MGQQKDYVDVLKDALLLKRTEVERCLAMSRASIERLLASDPSFPRPVFINTGRGKMRRWLAADIEKFVARLGGRNAG